VALNRTGLALAAVAGTWLGHTIEYLRVWGSGNAFGSVHTYMGPVGAVLAVTAVLGVRSTAQLAARLERRLAMLWKGSADLEPGSAPSSVGLPGLVLTLWVSQVGLYLLQENLEQAMAHHPTPGLAPVSGVHALAPVVHLVVAASIAVVLWAARRRVTELAEAIHQAEGWLRSGWLTPAPVTVGAPPRVWTPRERWGVARWSRPPPARA